VPYQWLAAKTVQIKKNKGVRQNVESYHPIPYLCSTTTILKNNPVENISNLRT
jgi:hypothetical protein